MKKFTLLLATTLLFGVIGCQKDDSPALKAPTKRTVTAYVFGDIDLWGAMLSSVNMMEVGWDPSTDGTMLVYLDASTHLTQFGAPVLLEIQHDTTDAIVSRVIKTYPNQNAADPKVLAQVLTDATELYPADSYGLMMAGHGNGWFADPEKAHGKSIGNSERFGSFLQIDQLAAALPVHYDFIVFNACMMGEAATLYQLRDKTDYVVASVESLPGSGLAYHTATSTLFAQPHADLYRFAQLSHRMYVESPYRNRFNYMTVGVYRLDQLEALAAEVNKALTRLNMKYNDLIAYAYEQSVDSPQAGGLLSYPYSNPGSLLLFDFGILYQRLALEDPAAAQNLKKAVERVVIQKYACGGTVNLDSWYTQHSLGLSFYIPYNPAINPIIKPINDAFYTRFAWSAASGFTSKWE